MGNQVVSMVPKQILPVHVYLQTSDIREIIVKLIDEHFQDSLDNCSSASVPSSMPLRHVPTIEFQECAGKPTNRAIYMLRPFLKHNLLQRLAMNPPLTLLEKSFIIYQILAAMSLLHEKKLYHGDLKLENVLLTSYLKVFISDFGLFKPTRLPSADPSQYYYFFSPSGRDCCSIAPERFERLSDGIDTGVYDCFAYTGKAEMDIFSVGCVIAEILIESPLFTLSTLLSYRDTSIRPQTLNQIMDDNLRALIEQMIDLNPERRPSLSHCLAQMNDQYSESVLKFIRECVFVKKLTSEATVSRVHHDLIVERSKVSSDVVYFMSLIVLANSSCLKIQLKAIEVMDGFIADYPIDFVSNRIVAHCLETMRICSASVKCATFNLLIKSLTLISSSNQAIYALSLMNNIEPKRSYSWMRSYFYNLPRLAALAFSESKQKCRDEQLRLEKPDRSGEGRERLLKLQTWIETQMLHLLAFDKTDPIDVLHCLQNFLTHLVQHLGEKKVLTFLLSNIGTIPNRSIDDWHYRVCFFDCLKSIASTYGDPLIERFAASFLVHGLTDSNDLVFEETIRLLINIKRRLSKFELIRCFHYALISMDSRANPVVCCSIKDAVDHLAQCIMEVYGEADYIVYVQPLITANDKLETCNHYSYTRRSLELIPSFERISADVVNATSLEPHNESSTLVNHDENEEEEDRSNEVGDYSAVAVFTDEIAQTTLLRPPELAFNIVEHHEGVSMLKMSKNDKHLMLSADYGNVVKLWNVTDIHNRHNLKSIQTMSLEDQLLMERLSDSNIKCISFTGSNSFSVGIEGHSLLMNVDFGNGDLKSSFESIAAVKYRESYVTAIEENLFLTSDSTLHLFDRRVNADQRFRINLPPENGMPICMEIQAPSSNVVFIGTNRGYLQWCDLRFGIFVSESQVEGATTIKQIANVESSAQIVCCFGRCERLEARVWDVLRQQGVAHFTSNLTDPSNERAAYLTSLATLNAKQVLLAGTDGRVRVWDLSRSDEQTSCLLIPSFYDDDEDWSIEYDCSCSDCAEYLTVEKVSNTCRHRSNNQQSRFALSTANPGHSNIITDIKLIENTILPLMVTASADHSIRIWRYVS